MTAAAIAGKKARIDLFDLDATLRSLGRRLLESDGLPIDYADTGAHHPASLLRDKDRIREDEHTFLMALVIGHFRRHETGPTPPDVHPCPSGTGATFAIPVRVYLKEPNPSGALCWTDTQKTRSAGKDAGASSVFCALSMFEYYGAQGPVPVACGQ